MATLAPEHEIDGQVAPTAGPLRSSRLLRWLDEGVDSHGERYREIRRRLLAYFDRHNRAAAAALADDTLRRISDALELDGVSPAAPPAQYCYIVAKRVLLEGVGCEWIALDAAPPADGDAARLERALDELTDEERRLVIDYYRDGSQAERDHRRRMAERMHVRPQTLAVVAAGLRDDLMASASPRSGLETHVG